MLFRLAQGDARYWHGVLVNSAVRTSRHWCLRFGIVCPAFHEIDSHGTVREEQVMIALRYS